MAGGAGPVRRAGLLISADLPAGFVFGALVASAQDREVVGTGRATSGCGYLVVEIAAVRGAPAAGECAGLVSRRHESGEIGWWPVGAGAVVEQPAGGVGDEAAPGAGGVGGDAPGDRGGDGSVPGEFAGLVIEAEQRGQRDGDVHGRTHALCAGKMRVVQGGDAEVDEGVARR